MGCAGEPGADCVAVTEAKTLDELCGVLSKPTGAREAPRRLQAAWDRRTDQVWTRIVGQCWIALNCRQIGPRTIRCTGVSCELPAGFRRV